MQKIVIKGLSTLSFHTPLGGEIIDLPEDATASVYFEWATVPGATEYELDLLSLSSKRSVHKTTSVPSLSVDALGPGQWTAHVTAKSSGQIFAKSADILFEVQIRPQPKPQIQNPREGDQFPAWEMIRVRWTRKVPGIKSEVVVYELSEKSRRLISTEIVLGQSSTWIKALNPGRYQLSVKNYINESPKFVEEASSFSVEPDPFGKSTRSLGLRFVFLGAVGMGTSTSDNQLTKGPLLPDGTISNDSKMGAIDLRAFGPLSGNIGFTTRFFGDFANSQYADNASFATTAIANKQNRFQLGLGPTLRIESFGPTKPLTFAVILGGSHLRPFGNSTESTFDLLSVIPEVSLIYSGWNSRYSIEARLQSEIPLLAGKGPVLGSGNVLPIPSLRAEGLLRRRFSDSVKGILGGELVAQKIRCSEKPLASDTTITDLMVFLKAGINWDF